MYYNKYNLNSKKSLKKLHMNITMIKITIVFSSFLFQIELDKTK